MRLFIARKGIACRHPAKSYLVPVSLLNSCAGALLLLICTTPAGQDRGSPWLPSTFTGRAQCATQDRRLQQTLMAFSSGKGEDEAPSAQPQTFLSFCLADLAFAYASSLPGVCCLPARHRSCPFCFRSETQHSRPLVGGRPTSQAPQHTVFARRHAAGRAGNLRALAAHTSGAARVRRPYWPSRSLRQRCISSRHSHALRPGRTGSRQRPCPRCTCSQCSRGLRRLRTMLSTPMRRRPHRWPAASTSSGCSSSWASC